MLLCYNPATIERLHNILGYLILTMDYSIGSVLLHVVFVIVNNTSVIYCMHAMCFTFYSSLTWKSIITTSNRRLNNNNIETQMYHTVSLIILTCTDYLAQAELLQNKQIVPTAWLNIQLSAIWVVP